MRRVVGIRTRKVVTDLSRRLLLSVQGPARESIGLNEGLTGETVTCKYHRDSWNIDCQLEMYPVKHTPSESRSCRAC